MDRCIYCMQRLQNDTRFCPRCGKDQSPAIPEHHLPPGTVLGRKYLVGAALGQGGFGITYMGLDTTLDLRVAIKEFFPAGFVTRVGAVSTEVREISGGERSDFYRNGKLRFLQEARVLAKFTGARGIVDVRDFFEENNTAYIVMEYVDGVTLKQYLKDHGTLSPEETLRLFTPVMESLRQLHKENVIHRDISPDNIMLTDGLQGEVKLLDFGAARSVEGDNKSLSVLLKPGYAPEEQYRSKGKQGPWTDVYALCATMYRCITGVRPDESPDRLDEDTLQPPSALGISIAPETEAALLKGLGLKARDRWQGVDDLLDAIRREPEITIVIPQSLQPPADITKTAFASYDSSAEPINETHIQLPTVDLPATRHDQNDATKIGTTLTFGTYLQSNTNKKESIEWLVLDEQDNHLLLLSKYALDCQPFNTELTDITWENCTLRYWLNNDFYRTAFNHDERRRILSVTVTADNNPFHKTDPGNNTNDKIFLLSIHEARTYFSSDKSRTCQPTLQTKKSGVSVLGTGFCWWWLRTVGGDSLYNSLIRSDGGVMYFGNVVDSKINAVRPAMWIDPEA